MPASIQELLLAYARLGIDHWRNTSPRVKNKARKIGVDIASNQEAATRVVVSPYVVNKSPDNYLKLIPMPCEQRRVYAAFFTLWQSNATSPNPQSLAFDLIVLSQQGPAITFRLEPANLDHKTRHGYDHIQLSKTLARRSVSLKDALSVLPTTYPAFPIPAKDPLTRFLTMAVAMHGFPDGLDSVIRKAFNGRPTAIKEYQNLTDDMMST